ncbi:MAG: DUF4190 domain-containing protein [Phycisphaerales bacterium]
MSATPTQTPAPASTPAPAASSAGAIDTRPWSLWSIAAIACGVLVVPPLCLIAPILGLFGLGQARYRGCRGAGLAWAGIVLGVVATLGWTMFTLTFSSTSRRMLLNGPVETINLGVSGDTAAFLDRFVDEHRDETAAQAFLAEVKSRYGSVIAGQQSEDQSMQGPLDVVEGRNRVRFELRFDRGAVPAEAVFVRHAEGKPVPFIMKWSSISLYPPGGGVLAYPPGSPETSSVAGPPPGHGGLPAPSSGARSSAPATEAPNAPASGAPSTPPTREPGS